MKRIISLAMMIAICMSLFMSMSVIAADKNTANADYKAEIIKSLNRLEIIKDEVGLRTVEFEKLRIGSRLYSYIYTGTGFEESRLIYPLLYNNELVALAIQTYSGAYQISTDLAKDINRTEVSSAAVIYDAYSCWIYNGVDFIPVKNNMSSISGRGDLTNEIRINTINTVDLQLCSIYYAEDLGYKSNSISNSGSRSMASSYICSVSYVTQLLNGQSSNICWAATIACIKNYIDGTNYSAIDVAQLAYGECCFNQGITPENSQLLMREYYDLYYTFHEAQPSDTVIATNLQNGYPIYGIFTYPYYDSQAGAWMLGGHAVTVYGIDTSNEYIRVMDPEFGPKIVLKEGNTYSYISDYSDVELTFYHALCRTW